MSVTVAEGPGVTVTVTVAETIDFATPPPGLMDLHRFTLAALDDTGFLFALRSTDEPDVRLFVVPPRAYFPGYTPELDPSATAALGLDGGPALLLVVVHPGQDGHPPYANLLAPVAVNPRTGTAVQVVLDGGEWPLRAPLTATSTAA